MVQGKTKKNTADILSAVFLLHIVILQYVKRYTTLSIFSIRERIKSLIFTQTLNGIKITQFSLYITKIISIVKIDIFNFIYVCKQPVRGFRHFRRRSKQAKNPNRSARRFSNRCLQFDVFSSFANSKIHTNR